MNAKEYIIEQKDYFKNVEDWCKFEIEGHLEAYKNNDIIKVDATFIQELLKCTTWEEAEDIANRYII